LFFGSFSDKREVFGKLREPGKRLEEPERDQKFRSTRETGYGFFMVINLMIKFVDKIGPVQINLKSNL